jgi:hypothetical protein
MVARVATLNQLEPKRQQPVRWNDAMIFRSWAGVISEVALNLAQPTEIAPRHENFGNPMNLGDIACSCDRTDAATKVFNKVVDDLGRHMCDDIGVLIEGAISPAEVE